MSQILEQNKEEDEEKEEKCNNEQQQKKEQEQSNININKDEKKSIQARISIIEK